MDKTMVVDRIEAGIAVAEDAETQQVTYIPLSDLPKGVREGDVIVQKAQNGGVFVVDPALRREREIRIRAKMARLKSNPK